MSTEEIGRLVSHSSTRITEAIYRRELRPVISTGAEVMDVVFGAQLSTDSRTAYRFPALCAVDQPVP